MNLIQFSILLQRQMYWRLRISENIILRRIDKYCLIRQTIMGRFSYVEVICNKARGILQSLSKVLEHSPLFLCSTTPPLLFKLRFKQFCLNFVSWLPFDQNQL